MTSTPSQPSRLCPKTELSPTPHYPRQEKALFILRKGLQAYKKTYELTSLSPGKASLDDYFPFTGSDLRSPQKEP